MRYINHRPECACAVCDPYEIDVNLTAPADPIKMSDKASAKITLAELTTMLGLPEHDQQAVFSWTGETDTAHTWTLAEAVDLIEAWQIDSDRIASES